MKKTPIICIMILIAAALGGCTTSFKPATPYDKEISREFDHPYQVSWDAVLDFITAPGFRLDQVSKDSGYVSIAHKLRTDNNELVDCGTFVPGLVRVGEDLAIANLAARFKKLSDDRSIITVIVSGSRIIRGVDNWDRSYFSREYPCESTGQLERKMLDYVENYKE